MQKCSKNRDNGGNLSDHPEMCRAEEEITRRIITLLLLLGFFCVFFVNNVNQVTTYNWLATGKRTQEVPRLQGKREGMSLCVCVCVCECCK